MRKPPTGGIPAAILKGLKRVRYAAGDILYVIGHFLARVARLLVRIPVAIGRAARRFWRSLSVIARRRLAAALGVAVILLVFFSAVVPNLPCGFPGGDSCPPADDAAEVVPASALAYLHANLDPETDEYAAAAELGAEVPVLGGQLIDRMAGLLPAPGEAALDFDEDVRPWFGGEAALAVLPGTGVLEERAYLLEVDDSEGAAEYISSISVGSPQTTEYEGVEVSVDQRDLASAEVEGFLVLGTEDGVRAVIATATGADEAPPLADDETATAARDELPEHRFAEAWLSEEGVTELIAGDRGTLGTLTPLIDPGASRGVAVSLSAEELELELAVRSSLDPERAETSPGFFAAFPAFDPELVARLPPETLAYVGIGAPARTVRALLSQASAQAPGIAAGFTDLVESVRRAGGVELEGDLVDALGDESAFALEPPPGAAAIPYLLFAADGVDEDAAREALAALQTPLARGADSGDELGGSAFDTEQLSGVETSSVRVSPTVELTYAVFDGLVAVATDPDGVAALIGDQGGLDESQRYESATEDFPEEVALQAYLDLGGLVETGEQAGLAEDPLYATFAGDFRRLETLGLAISDSGELLSTDARLLIGEAPPTDTTSDPLAPAGD